MSTEKFIICTQLTVDGKTQKEKTLLDVDGIATAIFDNVRDVNSVICDLFVDIEDYLMDDMKYTAYPDECEIGYVKDSKYPHQFIKDEDGHWILHVYAKLID